MLIKTKRLLLRPYTSKDLTEYHLLNSDPRLLTYELHPPFDLTETETNLYSWIHITEVNNGHFGTYEMGIELVGENRLIGLLSTTYRDIGSLILEVGMRINADYQQQGFATEALKAVINTAFSTTDIHRVFGCTDARNAGCIKVFENVGMQREGHLRQHIRLPDDTYADEVIYAILAEE